METKTSGLNRFLKENVYKRIPGLLIAATHYTYAVIFGWLVLNWVFGDRWWWLFVLNTFAEYLFLLVPLAVVTAVITRQRAMVIGLVGIIVAWVFLYGRFFLPPLSLSRAAGAQITVITSNLLGYNTHPEGVISSIRASDADVIALQELNPGIAEAIQQELVDAYPYQVLAPEMGVTGLGVISRYPLEATGIEIEGIWAGSPQLLEVAWEGREITLVNFHAIPPGRRNPGEIEFTVRERERQIGALMAFVGSRSGPAIVLGDLNVTDRSAVYREMAGPLQDAWVERGWGLGHTFPGAASVGSSRPTLGGIPVPKWLLRLDYVFCSEHWQVERAWIGPWDGVSDHRPVMARMTLIR
jgi:endonuclease/exonuclease/phosphatase (EEP) superfamily protein YafD